MHKSNLKYVCKSIENISKASYLALLTVGPCYGALMRFSLFEPPLKLSPITPLIAYNFILTQHSFSECSTHLISSFIKNGP